MARLEQRFWEPRGGFDVPRRQRRGGYYSVYIPDKLVGRTFVLNGDVAADVADAEREIAALDSTTTALADTEALARLLLRAESVASSRMEGLIVGPRRLLKAEIARQIGQPTNSVTESEVLANIDAMAIALTAVDEGSPISIGLLQEMHVALLKPTADSAIGGVIRTEQNWTGKSNSPIDADFVPPPPELVRDLLSDLCDFCNSDSLPAVAQAAIAHAQFETIHPFADGNGRVGRALIHMVLRRRKLTTRVTPPISLVLATLTQDYIGGLTVMRYDGDPSSPEAIAGTDRWMETFASACRRAVRDANLFEQRIADVQAKWLAALGTARSSAAVRLIRALPGAPMITASGAAKLIERTLPATMEGIARLIKAGVLSPTVVGRKRGQVYEAGEIIDAFTALERQLGSPAGDTQVEEPVRPVPTL